MYRSLNQIELVTVVFRACDKKTKLALLLEGNRGGGGVKPTIILPSGGAPSLTRPCRDGSEGLSGPVEAP